MPKETKTSQAKQKIVTGGLRTVSTKKKMLLATVMIALIGIVGFLGYGTYKSRSAFAAYPTILMSKDQDGYAVVACRIAKTSNPPYSPNPGRVRVAVARPFDVAVGENFTLDIIRHGKVIRTVSSNGWWYNGVLGIKEVLYDDDTIDTVRFQIKKKTASGTIAINRLTWC